MDLLTLEHFTPYINDTFSASLVDGEVPFVLVEARPLPIPANYPGLRAPYSLLFRNGAPLLFPQQTYQVKHEKMGQFGLFLVPIARERDGFIYQAVFS